MCVKTASFNAPHRVDIDGREYVPVDSMLSAEAMQALGKAYSIAYGFGVYDPDPDPKHLRDIFNCLCTANKELRFKE